jgi:ankyrin repeat protein
LACNKRQQPDVAKTLLLAGADVNARSGDGTPTLHTAIRSESVDVLVVALLAAGVDADAADMVGRKAIDVAKGK